MYAYININKGTCSKYKKSMKLKKLPNATKMVCGREAPKYFRSNQHTSVKNERSGREKYLKYRGSR